MFTRTSAVHCYVTCIRCGELERRVATSNPELHGCQQYWAGVLVCNILWQRSSCTAHSCKAHYHNSSGSGSRRNTVGHALREIRRVCWYFLVRNNTITCKVTDKRQRSNIRSGKGLEVPCMPSQVEKLIRSCHSDF